MPVINSDRLNGQTICFEGPCHLVDTPQKLSLALDKLFKAKQLGFDTETRPSFKKGDHYKISLLQLATEDEAFLFRTLMIGNLSDLFSIIENPQTLKVGLAVHDDLKGLNKLHPLKPQNVVDLQHVAKEKGHTKLGLKSLVESVLGAHLSKKDKLTNWETSRLSDKQLVYAATDAWISLHLYHRLQSVTSPPHSTQE